MNFVWWQAMALNFFFFHSRHWSEKDNLLLIPRELANLEASRDYVLNLPVNTSGIWKVFRENLIIPQPALPSSVSNHHFILTLCGEVNTLACSVNITFEIHCRELSRSTCKLMVVLASYLNGKAKFSNLLIILLEH